MTGKFFEVMEIFNNFILNRYEQLCTKSQSDENDTTKTYENLIHANSKAAKELIPPKTRSKRKVIPNNPDVISARLKVNSAFSNYEKEPTMEKEKLLQDEKANLKMFTTKHMRRS